MAELSTSDAGRAWLADLESRKHPWFFMSTGDGFYHHHRAWIDDLRLPFAAITGYIAQLREGRTLDRPQQQILAERDRIATEYAALLATDEERAQFEQMVGLCRHVFPHAEGHKFFIEHWGTTLFFNKLREVGAVFAEQGFFAERRRRLLPQHPRGARGALGSRPRLVGRHARVAAPSTGRRGSRGARRSSRASATGRRRPRSASVPEVINDPTVQLLWGVTVGPSARLGERRGRATSAATARRRASSRASHASFATIDEIGDVQSGEVLVCSVTAPSWGPVFPKIAAAVSDIGGMMSHAAIVAREYGLARRRRHRERDVRDQDGRPRARRRQHRHRDDPRLMTETRYAIGFDELGARAGRARRRQERASRRPAPRRLSRSRPASPSRRARSSASSTTSSEARSTSSWPTCTRTMPRGSSSRRPACAS